MDMKKGLLFLVLVLCLGLLPAMALADMEIAVYRDGQKLENGEYVMPGDELSVQVSNAGDTELDYVWTLSNPDGGIMSKKTTFTVAEEDAGSGCELSVRVRDKGNNRKTLASFHFFVARRDAEKYNINLIYNEEGGSVVTQRTWAYEDSLFRVNAVPKVGWRVGSWMCDAPNVGDPVDLEYAEFVMPSRDVTLEVDFEWLFDFELQDDRGNVIPLDGTGQILCDRTYIPFFKTESNDRISIAWEIYSDDYLSLQSITEFNNRPLVFTTELYRECVELCIADGAERVEPMNLCIGVRFTYEPLDFFTYLDFIIPKPETVPQYPVMVNDTVYKKYLEGEMVHLTAEKKPGSIAFEGWEGLEGLQLLSGSAASESISFIMPNHPVYLNTVGYVASDMSNPPCTGDASALGLWLALMVGSLLGMFALRGKKQNG